MLHLWHKTHCHKRCGQAQNISSYSDIEHNDMAIAMMKMMMIATRR